jgi:beta-galactosidase/beta-glucuronidase
MPQAQRKNLAHAFTDAMRTQRVVVAALFALLLLLPGSLFAQAQAVKLERGWQFLADTAGTLKATEVGQAAGWRDARVSVSWNAQFADLRDYMGVAWYRTQFESPELKNGQYALLKFGAVDYFSEVFVNGQKVGEHEGGYTPFGFVVTEKLKPGANELLVRVVDPPMDEKENRARFPEMMYNEIPHGKQNWYVQTGGIWQPVWIDFKPAMYIEQVHMTPSVNGDFSMAVRVAGSVLDSTEPSVFLNVIVRDPNGQSVFTKTVPATLPNVYTISGQVKSPRLWRPDAPMLYSVEATLSGVVKDAQHERFGFRSFEARDGKFYLNNEPFYMIAALDQDFYPETVYTTPSEDYVREMMKKAKRLGLNLLRCHIKVCDPVYLKVADEVGMLVWYEIPSWNDFNHFSVKAAERGERIFAEMTARDWNHPSIVIQSIINESWGADLKKPEQRRWLREAFDRAKKLTAPRGLLVVDNSACCENFHLKTDINDFHQYFSQPDNHERWDKWVADFASRPKWTFSQHGDGQPTGREPLVVSEFGNWGLPKLPKDLPWWFARDFGGREVTRPAGVHDRFKAFQLATLFRDYDQLAEATQWHQFRSLKHEIEEIRRHASIQGYVITEFTDINWEANGLMDMWRNQKVYADELAKIQQPDLLMARTPKRNYVSGEQVQFEVLLSHYSQLDLKGAELIWRTETAAAKNRQEINNAVARSSVTRLARHSFPAPEVMSPRRERILLEARDSKGKLIAEGNAEIFVYPKSRAKPKTSDLLLTFHDPRNGNPELKRALLAAGHSVGSNGGPLPHVLMIATLIDDYVKTHLRNGGRAIILANSKEAFPTDAAFKVVPREGDLDGNWVTNFNWVRTNQEPFSAVALNPLLGFEGVKTVPRFIIQGIPGAAYGDVLSGIFYGWINNNAALAVQMRAGTGKLLATTFRFDEYGRDPYATHLLDAMIHYVAGQNFAPVLDWK